MVLRPLITANEVPASVTCAGTSDNSAKADPGGTPAAVNSGAAWRELEPAALLNSPTAVRGCIQWCVDSLEQVLAERTELTDARPFKSASEQRERFMPPFRNRAESHDQTIINR